ncbi:hypothetical protein [Candidatus Parabeggiatoa sp. HSG14]|uniref:hypothetical protein n=1 Tax=Candidatus Parabeggiatoa sp. HSG14 TaxID=3055593 RepID=UPI0025A77334|nr:hypothetical protein [Thiotrichales bacterium HSG14]
MKEGLDLKEVVLVGRIYDEYAQYFDFQSLILENHKILDVAAGVSSFCAEAHDKNYDVLAADPIYEMSADDLEHRCQKDLTDVLSKLPEFMDNYQWDLYKNLAGLRQYREKAYKKFILHFAKNPQHYAIESLPNLSFQDNAFTLTLSSYFLFLYDELFDYDFHRDSLLELSRVTSGEVRIYPLVNLKATQSSFVEQILNDEKCHHLEFEIKKVDFEFVKNANELLIVRKA